MRWVATAVLFVMLILLAVALAYGARHLRGDAAAVSRAPIKVCECLPPAPIGPCRCKLLEPKP